MHLKQQQYTTTRVRFVLLQDEGLILASSPYVFCYKRWGMLERRGRTVAAIPPKLLISVLITVRLAYACIGVTLCVRLRCNGRGVTAAM